MARPSRSGDLYFVLASCLGCIVLFCTVIVPRVEANRAARRQVRAVVANTREILDNARALDRKAEALRAGDPFLEEAARRWYLELRGQPWPER